MNFINQRKHFLTMKTCHLAYGAAGLAQSPGLVLCLNFKLLEKLISRYELKDTQQNTILNGYNFHSVNWNCFKGTYFFNLIDTPHFPRDFQSNKMSINSLPCSKKGTGNKNVYLGSVFLIIQFSDWGARSRSSCYTKRPIPTPFSQQPQWARVTGTLRSKPRVLSASWLTDLVNIACRLSMVGPTPHYTTTQQTPGIFYLLSFTY